MRGIESKVVIFTYFGEVLQKSLRKSVNFHLIKKNRCSDSTKMIVRKSDNLNNENWIKYYFFFNNIIIWSSIYYIKINLKHDNFLIENSSIHKNQISTTRTNCEFRSYIPNKHTPNIERRLYFRCFGTDDTHTAKTRIYRWKWPPIYRDNWAEPQPDNRARSLSDRQTVGTST